LKNPATASGGATAAGGQSIAGDIHHNGIVKLLGDDYPMIIQNQQKRIHQHGEARRSVIGSRIST